MNGTFYKVTGPGTGELVQLAVFNDADESMWSYDRSVGVFWRNNALTHDFLFGDLYGESLDYEAVTDEDATQLARVVPAFHADARQEFMRGDIPSVPACDVLVVAVPSKRAVTMRRVASITKARPGAWVTWKTYDLAHEQAARVAASSVRHDKTIALRGLVDDADVQRKGEGWVVKVRRRDASQDHARR